MSENKVLKNPVQIDRLNALRKKLAGTDRDDHLKEIDEKEKQALEALLALSLEGNDAIRLLTNKAGEEIKMINELLMTGKPDDLSPNAAIKFAAEVTNLHHRRDMWIWFRGFFLHAKENLKEVEVFLKEQEKEDTDGAPQWQ